METLTIKWPKHPVEKLCRSSKWAHPLVLASKTPRLNPRCSWPTDWLASRQTKTKLQMNVVTMSLIAGVLVIDSALQLLHVLTRNSWKSIIYSAVEPQKWEGTPALRAKATAGWECSLPFIIRKTHFRKISTNRKLTISHQGSAARLEWVSQPSKQLSSLPSISISLNSCFPILQSNLGPRAKKQQRLSPKHLQTQPKRTHKITITWRILKNKLAEALP